MSVEVLILCRNEAADHALRHRLDRDEDSALGREFSEQAPVAGMDAGHGRRLIVRKLGIFRQALAEVVNREHGAAGGHHGDEQKR